jgi:hypothetical protein
VPTPVDPTLSDLRTSALDYADMTGSSFPVTARVTEYVNRSIARLFDLIAGTAGIDDYLRITGSNITMVAGTEDYTVSATVGAKTLYPARILGVYYVGGGTDRLYPLERWEPNGITGYKRGPLAAGTLQVDFFPRAPLLSADADTVGTQLGSAASLDFCQSWPDWVALSAAIKLLMREESDPSALMAERDQIWADMVMSAEPRDMFQGGTVADVAGRFDQATYRHSEWRDVRYRYVGANKIRLVEADYRGEW